MFARPIQLGAHGLTAALGSFTHGLLKSPDGPELAFLRLDSVRQMQSRTTYTPARLLPYSTPNSAALSDRIAPAD
jgi:hypothetical protein